MTDSRDSVPDSRRSRLRTIVAAIESELARLPPDVTGLRASVADLVQALALGPEPEYRRCPVCARFDMRAATVCGHCWTKLPPTAGPDALVGS